MTREENSFIDGIELQRDYGEPVTDEEHYLYEELIKKRKTEEKYEKMEKEGRTPYSSQMD